MNDPAPLDAIPLLLLALGVGLGAAVGLLSSRRARPPTVAPSAPLLRAPMPAKLPPPIVKPAPAPPVLLLPPAPPQPAPEPPPLTRPQERTGSGDALFGLFLGLVLLAVLSGGDRERRRRR